MSRGIHTPVLLTEAIEFLAAERKGLYLDCTVGLGGHTRAILEQNPKSRLVGFDMDESALLRAEKNLNGFADRIELYQSDFRNIPDLDLEFSQVRGILFDLGISSLQLDTPERGFSYSHEGPLDMRMDLRSRITAAKIVNKYSEPKLAQIFYDYGELRQSRKLAAAIASRRKIQTIETTTQLFRIVEDVCHWRPQRGKTHPAARVFQALRIEVNHELVGLDDFLERTITKLPAGARIVGISFHSLEDRIVKHTFSRLASGQDSPPVLKVLTKKPVLPSESEVTANFRSRSAKLRAAERM
ncbi:MAG: 16S rRNA (cytosine(1402)-N(4))-methyltransferase RsmH [Candidatus Aminicenantes bacterium]|nr:16S rRNA (cytosine(1402)-N(4))-methyltransferase RsmH [Candidatus Aminicenantes bacterium]